MAATIYYAADADPTKLEGKKIAILGYGSQGHAHALNLQESGHNVIVGLYKGSSSIKKAEEDGLQVMESAEACKNADIIMMLVPDHLMGQIYSEDVLPNLLPGNTLMFAHGFSIHYGLITPPEGVDVVIVATK